MAVLRKEFKWEWILKASIRRGNFANIICIIVLALSKNLRYVDLSSQKKVNNRCSLSQQLTNVYWVPTTCQEISRHWGCNGNKAMSLFSI